MWRKDQEGPYKKDTFLVTHSLFLRALASMVLVLKLHLDGRFLAFGAAGLEGVLGELSTQMKDPAVFLRRFQPFAALVVQLPFLLTYVSRRAFTIAVLIGIPVVVIAYTDVDFATVNRILDASAPHLTKAYTCMAAVVVAVWLILFGGMAGLLSAVGAANGIMYMAGDVVG